MSERSPEIVTRDEMPPSKHDEKLQAVLELFLLPDYNIASTTYLDILLSHLTGKGSKSSPKSKPVDRTILQNWLIRALDVWSAGSAPCQAVIVFTLKLVGSIFESELDSQFWHREDVLNRLVKVFRLRDDNLTASVKMAYTVMLLDLIDQPSGRQWVIESGVWRDIVKFCHTNHTLYLTRESQKFVWTLLRQESKNTDLCQKVILEAAAPLINDTFDSQLHPSLEEKYLQQNSLLLSTVVLLNSILENTLFFSLDNTIPELLESLTNLQVRSEALFEACISTQFRPEIQKLLLLLTYHSLKQGIKGPGELVDKVYFQRYRNGILYLNNSLLNKVFISDIVRMLKQTMIYWSRLCNLCDFKMKEKYDVEHQIVILMIIPPIVCMRNFSHTDEDMLETFINKIFHVTCEYTQRVGYIMRDSILKADMPLEHIAKTSIQMLLDVLDIMHRDTAVITFQTMYHLLESYMPSNYNCSSAASSSENNHNRATSKVRKKRSIFDGDPMVEYPNLLFVLLNGLSLMTKKFKLKWQECVETICLLSLAQEVLSHPNVLPKLCVQTLELSKLAIQNFMPPNLALLVTSKSHMDEMGPKLFKRLHDPNWEVRDSVLEVVNTIAHIAEQKYPAFQDLLLVNGFPQLVVDVATSDGESYVRASALTCIATFVRINRIWSEVFCHLDLPAIASKLMTDESEGIVRREAVVLLKELYVRREWPKTTINEMTQTMAAAAVLDLHWEVKVNALEFWKQFVKSHLADQGMLDGQFPTMTFSKEHRKIMSLNSTEIKRRLNKALDELAKQSCLGVLLATLQDDSDFQVCKASAEIIKTLKDFLLKYKINEPPPESPSPKNRAMMDTAYVRDDVPPRDTEMFHDNRGSTTDVIDAIVNENDINLLTSVYQRSLKVEEVREKTDSEKLKFLSEVTRCEFLRTILNADIDAYIEEKSRWLKTYTNSFDSVLEDIVMAREKKDVNSLDCY